MSKRIVIIGAGHCGGRVAEHLRKRGFSGSISLIGAEHHAPYERPPLSKAALSKAALSMTTLGPSDTEDRWDPESITLLSPDKLAELEIDWIAGRNCIDIEPEQQGIVLDDGQRLDFDALVLTTGASPIQLPLEGADLPQVMDLRSREDAAAIEAELTPGKHVVVIGAGFIGLEVAASARQRGCDVTVLEAGTRPLARGLPQDTTDVIAQLHTERGVSIRTAMAVTGFESVDGALSGVTLQGGESLPADLVVVGIGIRPNTQLAQRAGLAIDNGILTNNYGHSSHPAIWAAGDCANAYNSRYNRSLRLESWKNAELMAEVVAQDIISCPPVIGPEISGSSAELENNAVPWLWSDHFDYGLQTAGFPAEGDQIVTRIDGDIRIDFALRGGKLIGAAGFAPGAKAARDIRMAQMMLENDISPAAEDLANPARKMKALLKGK